MKTERNNVTGNCLIVISLILLIVGTSPVLSQALGRSISRFYGSITVDAKVKTDTMARQYR